MSPRWPTILATLLGSLGCSCTPPASLPAPRSRTSAVAPKASSSRPRPRAPRPGSRLDLSVWHHPSYVHRLVTSPDGATLLSCGGGLLATDSATGEHHWYFIDRRVHCLGDMAFGDGVIVVEEIVGMDDTRLLALGLEDGELRPLPSATTPVVAHDDEDQVAVESPTGRRLITGSPALGRAVSPDGAWIAASLENGCIALWRGPRWDRIPVPCDTDREATHPRAALAFDGSERLYWAGYRGDLRGIDLTSQALLPRPPRPFAGPITSVRLSPSAQSVTLGDGETALRWRPPAAPVRLDGYDWLLPLPLDDRRLAGVVRGPRLSDPPYWVALGAPEPTVVEAMRGFDTDRLFRSADGSRLLAVASRQLRMLTADGRVLATRDYTLRYGLGSDVVASAGLNLIASTVYDGDHLDVVVIETASGAVRWSLSMGEEEPTVLDFSPDATRLLVGLGPDLRVHRTEDGSLLRRIASPSHWPLVEAAWLDDERIVLGLGDGSICLSPSRECSYVHVGGVVDVDVADDGALVTAGPLDVVLWE